MKIEVFTLCWNEIDVLPWVVDYWKRYASHVTVFDNGSTDGSVEFLCRHDWITVEHFETDGLNDTVHQKIKEDCWKGSDADFVVVCDMDECVLAKDVNASFERMRASGATICLPRWYELMAEERPVYEDGKLLHETSPMAKPFQAAAKAIIFDPVRIKFINYTPGAHQCAPRGEVRYYDGNDILCLHINHNLSLDYKLRKYKQLDARRSDENIIKHHGIHYAFSEQVLTDAWNEDMRHIVNLNDVING